MNATLTDQARLRLSRGFAIICLATLMGGLGIGMVSPLLPVFAEEMGASGIWLGLAFSGFAITQTPLTPFMGRLSDRFGRKLFLAGGMLIYSLAALGYVFSPTYQLLTIFRIFSGVGAAMFFPVAFAYVGDLAPRGMEGRYMGLFNVAFLVGWGAGPVLGGLFKDSLGTDATFWAMMVMSAIAFVVVALLLPKPRVEAQRESPSNGGVPMLGVLKDRVVSAICTFELIWGLGFGGVFAFLPIFMTDNLGTTATAVGIVISTRAILNGVLVYPYGWLADRVNRVRLMMLGATLGAVGTFAVPWMTGFAPLLLLFAITGLFESMSVPAGTAIAVERGRHLGMGSVMGLYSMSWSVGMLIGSVAGGIIQDFSGIENVFRYGAVVVLFGVGIFYLMMRRAQYAKATVG